MNLHRPKPGGKLERSQPDSHGIEDTPCRLVRWHLVDGPSDFGIRKMVTELIVLDPEIVHTIHQYPPKCWEALGVMNPAQYGRDRDSIGRWIPCGDEGVQFVLQPLG